MPLYTWLARLAGNLKWQAAEKWWKGNSVPNAQSLARLATGLKTTTAYLRGESPERFSQLDELVEIWNGLQSEPARLEILNYARYVSGQHGSPSPTLIHGDDPLHQQTLTDKEIAPLLERDR